MTSCPAVCGDQLRVSAWGSGGEGPSSAQGRWGGGSSRGLRTRKVPSELGEGQQLLGYREPRGADGTWLERGGGVGQAFQKGLGTGGGDCVGKRWETGPRCGDRRPCGAVAREESRLARHRTRRPCPGAGEAFGCRRVPCGEMGQSRSGGGMCTLTRLRPPGGWTLLFQPAPRGPGAPASPLGVPQGQCLPPGGWSYVGGVGGQWIWGPVSSSTRRLFPCLPLR